MFQKLLTPVRLVTLLCGALVIPSLRAGESMVPTAQDRKAQTEYLSPFTHLASIPADADLKTIRFQEIRLVNVPITVKRVYDANYCAGVEFREPGGSMFCPETKTASAAAAYRVTYSYVGQPMASDEFANRYFTFAVYFRPEEISPEVRRALAARKPETSDIAGNFSVMTSRELVRRVGVDTAQSRFCAGSYIDGLWSNDQPRCKDNVHYAAFTTPSDYITVSVNAASNGEKRIDCRCGSGSFEKLTPVNEGDRRCRH